MKTKLFTFIIAIIILNAQNASAKILRVGYFSTAIAGQDFVDFQTAHNAASTGDTLLIYPGSYSGTMSKKLVIVGYGYYVTGTGANADLQSTMGVVSLNTLNLATGSDNSIIEGIDGLTIASYGSAVILSGITVNRCNVNVQTSQSNVIYNNLKITQSIVDMTAYYYYGNVIMQDILVENCILTLDLTRTPVSGCTGVFKNNIFTSAPNFNNGSYALFNNIFLGTTAPTNTTACIFMNNIATSNTIPSSSGNQPNVNLSTVFIGYPTQGAYSNDGRYMLAASSPALGAGVSNGAINNDCGIFGGANPYRLSGIPAIPSFYKISAASPIANGTNPYNITFSVRSNN